MSISDESFREAFKPLHIPAHYADAHTDEHKVIFALAQIGEGTAADVAEKLANTDAAINKNDFTVVSESILKSLFERGLIKGTETGGKLEYNLSKITKANEGDVDPHLLAPGLD